MPPCLPLLLSLLAFGVSSALTGLIWTVQLVSYPLFAAVDEVSFRTYHAGHMRRISWVVVPLMLADVLLAVVLPWSPPAGAPAGLLEVASLLVAVVWLSTFLLQVPRHRRLAEGSSSSSTSGLVATNWIRTAAWTLRSVLLGWVLWCVVRVGGECTSW